MTGASPERIKRPTVSMFLLLPLKHAAELRQVGLEPVLLGVLQRRVFQVDDHFIDVVLCRRDFPLCLDLNRAGQVALRHGRGDFRDRADLRGEVRRELVHVVGQIFPGARRPARSPDRRVCLRRRLLAATVVT